MEITKCKYDYTNTIATLFITFEGNFSSKKLPILSAFPKESHMKQNAREKSTTTQSTSNEIPKIISIYSFETFHHIYRKMKNNYVIMYYFVLIT